MSISKACATRLQKEYKALIREWHFVLQGQDEFKGGVYHGKVTFPSAYPYKPPSIIMFTPNGRFATNTKLCMSMTDFHPESWNPMWSVGTILTGLLSFMNDTASSTGVVTSTPEEKAFLAARSMAFNMGSPTFRKLFPAWVKKHEESLRAPAEARDAAPAPAPQADGPQTAVPAPPQPAGVGQEPGVQAAPLLPGRWGYVAAAGMVAGGALALATLHGRTAEQ